MADAIPFTSELRFELEVITWLKDLLPIDVTEDAVAYWYADTSDMPAPLDLAAFTLPALDLSGLAVSAAPSNCQL